MDEDWLPVFEHVMSRMVVKRIGITVAGTFEIESRVASIIRPHLTDELDIHVVHIDDLLTLVSLLPLTNWLFSVWVCRMIALQSTDDEDTTYLNGAVEFNHGLVEFLDIRDDARHDGILLLLMRVLHVASLRLISLYHTRNRRGISRSLSCRPVAWTPVLVVVVVLLLGDLSVACI